MIAALLNPIRTAFARVLSSCQPKIPVKPFTDALAHNIRPADQAMKDWRERNPSAEVPRVSIITLNHNGARLLNALYTSLVAHNTYPNLEIILVDHASTDDSLKIVSHWQERLPYLRIITCEKNHSFSYSNNRAAEVATGDVLFFVNNDIQLIGDAIPRLLAALEDSGNGLIGMKQFKSRPGVVPTLPAPYHHIGVRFRWGKRRRYLTPYEVLPRPHDGELSRHPSHFPAVTGAVIMCQRTDFLELGGFSEDYIYGYEDIDLCLKFRLGMGRSVISVNDVYAFHEDGSTRKKRPGKMRRSQHRANIQAFGQRCGPGLSRELLGKILSDDGSAFGRPLKICVIPPNDKKDFPEKSFLKALAQAKDWGVNFQKRKRKGQLVVSADLVLSFDPSFWPHSVKSKFSHTAFIAMHVDHHPDWMTPGRLEDYDCVFASCDAGANAVCSATGIHPGVIALDDLEHTAATFVEAVRTRLQSRVRFSFKVGSAKAKQDPDLRAIADILIREGHSVRIDLPSVWLDMQPLGDDVAIIFPSAPHYPTAPGQLNLAFGVTSSENFIATTLPAPSGDAKFDAAQILDAWKSLGAPRTHGPHDLPLPDLHGQHHIDELVISPESD